jgi:hypothetical protein
MEPCLAVVCNLMDVKNAMSVALVLNSKMIVRISIARKILQNHVYVSEIKHNEIKKNSPNKI